MTTPRTSAKILLIADRTSAPEASGPVPIRRYRLARLRFDSPPTGPGAQFEHLKRVYD